MLSRMAKVQQRALSRAYSTKKEKICMVGSGACARHIKPGAAAGGVADT